MNSTIVACAVGLTSNGDDESWCWKFYHHFIKWYLISKYLMFAFHCEKCQYPDNFIQLLYMHKNDAYLKLIKDQKTKNTWNETLSKLQLLMHPSCLMSRVVCGRELSKIKTRMPTLATFWRAFLVFSFCIKCEGILLLPWYKMHQRFSIRILGMKIRWTDWL